MVAIWEQVRKNLPLAGGDIIPQEPGIKSSLGVHTIWGMSAGSLVKQRATACQFPVTAPISRPLVPTSPPGPPCASGNPQMQNIVIPHLLRGPATRSQRHLGAGACTWWPKARILLITKVLVLGITRIIEFSTLSLR
jgi:hypothetical protein